MGKLGGFLEYDRKDSLALAPSVRVKNFDEFHIPLSEEERRKQGARCMECGVPFCQNGKFIAGMASGCPLNNLIPEWNDLVYRGNYEAALKRLLKTSDFPEFTSRVCPALCEKACTCSLNGDAVSVKENELSIIEYGFSHGLMQPLKDIPRTDKKIAIIGSGPSGLACANRLNHRGHNVTVYERHDRPGGLLMYGIPNMKLEKQYVERRINLMKEEGVEFKCNFDVDSKKKANKLIRDYDAVVLCCGASNPRNIDMPGREAEGIYFAVDFLRSTTKALLDNGLKENYIDAKGKNVIVIGGGDTGNDCVGTCIRMGCKSITQLEMMPKPPLERRPSNPWPEWPNVLKTDYGQEEAIDRFGEDPRLYQTTLKEYIAGEDGKIKQAKLVSLSFTYNPETKRNDMKEVEGSERIVDCDLVLIASGFLGAQSYVTDAFGVDLTPRTVVKANEIDHKTSVEKVFAAGDVRRGQSLVVWAIREGRDCARAVDDYLMGFTNL